MKDIPETFSGQEASGVQGAGHARTPGWLAAEALLQLDPHGVHHAAAFDPREERPPQGRVFLPGAAQFDEICAWIDEREGAWNLYFTLN